MSCLIRLDGKLHGVNLPWLTILVSLTEDVIVQNPGNAFIYLVRALRLIAGVALTGVFFWALGDQKKTQAQYTEALDVFEEIASRPVATVTSDNFDPNREGEFVHVQGRLVINRPVDPLTGLSLEAITLIRHVEMLQWTEERYRPVNRSTDDWQYRYELVWSEELINADTFKRSDVVENQRYDNPGELPYETMRLYHGSISLDAWPLDLSLTDRLVAPQPVSAELLKTAPGNDQWSANGAYLYPARNAGSIASDEAGNVRIRYEYLPLAEGRYSVAGLALTGLLV